MEKSNEKKLTRKKNPLKIAGTVALYFLIAVLVSLLIFVLTCSLCQVEGSSMMNTLEHEQFVLLNKSQDANSGDIVVFYNESSGKNYVKRVIAVGGETIRFVPADTGIKTQKKISGEFEDVDEGYIKDYMSLPFGMIYTTFEEITIPPEEYFVMGDNRNDSTDSRFASVGTVDKSLVLGKVISALEPDSFSEWLCKLIFGFDWKNQN